MSRTARVRSRSSKQNPGKLESLSHLFSKFELEAEKIFRSVVNRSEQSAKELRKGIDSILGQIREEGLSTLALGKTDNLRHIAENLLEKYNAEEFINGAKRNWEEVIDTLSSMDLVEKAKLQASSTKQKVFNILSIPSQYEVIKLARKITALENKLNKLSHRKKAA